VKLLLWLFAGGAAIAALWVALYAYTSTPLPV
jgi:hypothetical protein